MLRASSCGFGHDSSPPVTLPQDPRHSFPVFFFLPYALHMFVITFLLFFFFLKVALLHLPLFQAVSYGFPCI